jgi:hypothetical protein
MPESLTAKPAAVMAVPLHDPISQLSSVAARGAPTAMTKWTRTKKGPGASLQHRQAR